jgi:hypothetical protein
MNIKVTFFISQLFTWLEKLRVRENNCQLYALRVNSSSPALKAVTPEEIMQIVKFAANLHDSAKPIESKVIISKNPHTIAKHPKSVNATAFL